MLTKLAKFPQARSRTFLGVLSDEDTPTSTSVLKERLAEVMAPDLSIAECIDILGEIFALAAFIESHGYPVLEAAESVASSTELDLTERQRKSFAQTLKVALVSRAVRSLGKAQDIATEHDRLFHTSRIFTDLRPVFDEVDDAPVGAVITHSLRLDFVRSGRIETIEIAMDGQDMDKLRVALDRADRKAVSLDRLMQTASVPVFRLTEGIGDDE